MVMREVTSSGTGAVELAAAEWLTEVTPTDATLLARLRSDIDAGEAEAVALAVERQALLLIDDRQGRRAAREYGIDFTGTVGLLIDAKLAGLIPSVVPLLHDLVASGVYLGAGLINRARRMAGESR
jgi:predicted nucleic acid-binding protein